MNEKIVSETDEESDYRSS